MNNNLGKEIFNQFLIEKMESEILTPQLDNDGFLSSQPSKISIPGSIGIIKANRSDEEIDSSEVNRFFFLNFKSARDKIKINLALNFVLYYKIFPSFQNIKISNSHKSINPKIIAKIKELKRNPENKNIKPEERNQKIFEDLNVFLNNQYNKNQHKGISLVISRIEHLLNNQSKEENILDDFGEELNHESDLDSEIYLDENSENKTFLNVLFFQENNCDEKIYHETIDKLTENDCYLYRELFVDNNPNFLYKPIKFSIEKKDIEISNNENLQNRIQREIEQDIEKNIIATIRNKQINLNIDKKLTLLHFLEENEYKKLIEEAIDQSKYEDVLCYFPSIKILKNGENIRINTYGKENLGKKNLSLFDNRIYNTSLEIEFLTEDLTPFKFNIGEDGDKNHYRYKNVKPIYCQSKYIATFYEQNDETIRITTTWNPKYYLPRNENTGIHQDKEKDLELFSFKSWIKKNNLDFSILEQIEKSYREWVDNIDLDSETMQSTSFQNDLKKWEDEIENISMGVKLLKTSHENIHNPYLSPIINAWECLNETFFLSNPEHSQWRMFQFCFVLSLIPNIVLSNENTKKSFSAISGINPIWLDEYLQKREKQINLLFFNAGGGKTEAFLAIVIYTLFFERFTGITHGVSAIIKYPLRLLLTQQTQRVFNLLCSAEKVRRNINLNNKSEYFDPTLSLGVWVGSSSTPNSIDNEVKETILEIIEDSYLSFGDRDLLWEEKTLLAIHENSKENIEKKKEIEKYRPNYQLEKFNFNKYFSNGEGSYKKIDFCPFCKGTDISLRIYQKTLFHFCLNKECYWNMNKKFNGLPIYIVDENVYERTPSVIISTTDKLSRMGYLSSGNSKIDVDNIIPENRKTLGIFGIAPYFDPSNKILSWKKSKSTVNLFDKKQKFIKFPKWIIQDETHLLIESLGSFSAIFERNFVGVILELQKIFSNNIIGKTIPSVIAATATISSPEKQLIPLYGRNGVSNTICLFPSPGYKLYENFYSRPKRKSNTINKINAQEYENYDISRIYNGYFLTDRYYFKAANRISLLHHKILRNINNNGISRDAFVNMISNKYYATTAKEFLANLNDDEFKEYIQNNVFYNKVLINYTGNKNTNEKLKKLESDNTDIIPEFKGVILPSNQKSITSDVSITQLQDILNNIKTQRYTFNDNDKMSIVRSIFATQSISHGVDSESFNAMIFNGIPEFVNEYIQASARIGRTNVGYVTILPMKNNKDKLILENFENFHRFIDRPILSNMIDYKTNIIISQAIGGLFISWYVNVFKMRESLGEGIRISENDFNEETYLEFKRYIKDILDIDYQLDLPIFTNDEEMNSEESIRNLKQFIEKNGKKIMTSLRDTEKSSYIIIGEKK